MIERKEIIIHLFELLEIESRYKEFEYLKEILLKTWEGQNFSSSVLNYYITRIATEEKVSSQKIILYMNKAIRKIWTTGCPNMIHSLFGNIPYNGNIPNCFHFLQTFLSILLVCEKTNTDMIYLLSEFKNPVYKNELFSQIISGFLVIILKKMGLADLFEEPLSIVETAVHDNSYGDAWMIYAENLRIKQGLYE